MSYPDAPTSTPFGARSHLTIVGAKGEVRANAAYSTIKLMGAASGYTVDTMFCVGAHYSGQQTSARRERGELIQT